MKVVIVAGGKGERLQPITNTIPKPMVKVKGLSLLEHIIYDFKSQGVKEFIISVCYLSEKIISYFGTGGKFGVKIQYLIEDQKNPLGTAGSIFNAKEIIKDTFIVTYADVLRDINIVDMRKFHKKNKGLGTIAVYKRQGTNPKSKIEFDRKKQIKYFIERPKEKLDENGNWSNAAIYIFEPEIFSFITPNTSQDFGKDIFPRLLEHKKRLFAYPIENFFIDIGDSNKLEKARQAYPYLEN
jgi:NDP-sugar pyrophosphorylase family protein